VSDRRTDDATLIAALRTLVEAVCPGYVLAPAASGAANRPESPVSSASGWLTAEERRLIERLKESAGSFPPSMHYFENITIREALVMFDALLARSSPPEVVLPKLHTRTEVNKSNHKSPCLWLTLPDVVAALAAAGVTVKEVS